MKAKPDCTGQKFGRLNVISKSGRCPRTNAQLWLLECDCGNVVERPRNSFDRTRNNCPSCGCFKKERIIERNFKRAKPDCTGQRFGRLLVIGKGSKKPDYRGSYIQLWRLQCDCGNVIEIPRESFEGKGQVSCGCKRRLGLVDNKCRPTDIAGQRFGQLTAIKLTGNKAYDKPTWLMQCDCGGTCELSLSKIRHYQRGKIRINCRDKTKHTDLYLEYPATPSLYPEESGELLKKYLHLTELLSNRVDSAVQDERRDRLLRVAWIITYRRQQGEEISELHEKRIILKWLRYSSVAVKVKRTLEKFAGRFYTGGNKNYKGDKMTNVTSLDYPEIETQGNFTLSISIESKPSKRLKFRRH